VKRNRERVLGVLGVLIALIAAVHDVEAAPTTPPNLVLVSIDGLRADRTGVYGASPSPTPGLDRLAAVGLVCDLALSQSNESLFSHAALLTGRHPSEIAPPDYHSFVLPSSALLIPEILKVYGYARAAFVAGGHVKGVYGFEQGFEPYWDDADFGSFFHTVPQAQAWLAEAPRAPFFMFLHGYDTHRPYLHAGLYNHVFDSDYQPSSTGSVDDVLVQSRIERVVDGSYYGDFPFQYFWHPGAAERILDPGGYARLREYAATHVGKPITPRDAQHIRAHYDSGALSADIQLSRFVETLHASGAWDHTLMAVVADHGEDLGDHGLYNHRSTLADSATRVPMILTGGALPEALRGHHIPGLCSAIDVAPTLLHAAGAVLPPDLPGRDLLSDAPAPPYIIQEGVLPMIAVRTPTHRLAVQGLPLDSPLLELLVRVAPIAAPTFSLYDLEHDPAEQINVLQTQPDVARTLREHLLSWLASRKAQGQGQAGPALDPAFRDLLRQRGYW
jgi:arylsulfatase A-like enzyme